MLTARSDYFLTTRLGDNEIIAGTTTAALDGKMENNFTPDDRPKLESAPQNQAEELQQLYDLAPCGYHSLDEDGLYLRINQTELQMLGDIIYFQAFHCRISVEYFSKSVQSIITFWSIRSKQFTRFHRKKETESIILSIAKSSKN
jgi:hypothetical protein